ncbi:hypothetical protein [Nonomuraea sp. NPDC049695]|uniref:hypothetical protein n=1 Tax=Nonomuraea sp. NPDC049695 TaxID=3154734 RepID=UPI003425BCF7
MKLLPLQALQRSRPAPVRAGTFPRRRLAQQARATARTTAVVIDLYEDDAGNHVAADLESTRASCAMSR